MFAYTPCMPTTKPNRSESPRSTQTPPCRRTRTLDHSHPAYDCYARRPVDDNVNAEFPTLSQGGHFTFIACLQAHYFVTQK